MEAGKAEALMTKLELLQAEVEKKSSSRSVNIETFAKIAELNKELEWAKSQIEIVRAEGEKATEDTGYQWQETLYHVMNAESLAELFKRYSEVFNYLKTEDEPLADPPARTEARELMKTAYAAEKLLEEQKSSKDPCSKRQTGVGVAETDSDPLSSGSFEVTIYG